MSSREAFPWFQGDCNFTRVYVFFILYLDFVITHECMFFSSCILTSLSHECMLFLILHLDFVIGPISSSASTLVMGPKLKL
jgi:hypothetical protein